MALFHPFILLSVREKGRPKEKRTFLTKKMLYISVQ